MISDKEKGLESVRATYNFISRVAKEVEVAYRASLAGDGAIPRDAPPRPTPPPCYALCVQHALKNAGSSKIEIRAPATAMARSATENEFEYHRGGLAKLLGQNGLAYMDDHRQEYAYVDLHTQQGLQTNYGEVSQNSAEQMNHSLMLTRDSPPVTAIFWLLSSQAKKFNMRYESACEAARDGFQVTPYDLNEVRESALFMRSQHGNARWCIEESMFSSSENRVVFRVFIGSRTSFNVTIHFDPTRDMLWYERIICECGWTLMRGLMCKHASFAMTYASREVSVPGRQYPPALLNIAHKMFYSSVYHIETYKKQFNLSLVNGGRGLALPETEILPIIHHELWPPDIQPRKGRKPKARKKKRQFVSAMARDRRGRIVMCSAVLISFSSFTVGKYFFTFIFYT